jgi:hypothetical protein
VLTGLEALTASARRAAGLAAAGMSNPKIAQPLVVTLNTVDGHRRHAGQKLPLSRTRPPPARTGSQSPHPARFPGGLNRPAGQAHNPFRSPDAKALAQGAAGGAKGVTMRSRPILASAAAVLTLSVVVALEAPPAAAAACGNGQGSPLLLGCDNNTATDATWINDSTADSFALGVNDTGSGSAGVVGFGGLYGVVGNSGTGTGVYGTTGAEGQNGVYGHASNTGGSGVYGQNDGNGHGVAGRADGGIGTLGDSANGIGVWANSQNATALKVSGKAQFSRSGVATVAGTAAAPKKSVKVSLPLTAHSMMTALLQKYVAGVYVVAAVPNVTGGYFTIYLNKPVSTSVGPIAWMVTEHP